MKVAAAAGVVLAGLLMPFGTVLLAGSGPTGYVASPHALDDIPGPMLGLYQEAAAVRCPGLPWPVLAAVGKVETDHARNVATSSAGARGPMQFMPGTWAAYGLDATGNGIADILDPVDSVHSAAHYLCANGGGHAATLRRALWHYNRADWYVELVLEHAARYAVLARAPVAAPAAALLDNPRVQLTDGARADVAAGIVDPRVVAVLAAAAQRHTIGVSVFRSGHSKYVAGTTRISNHWCGQAADVWMVDGAAVTRSHPTARVMAVWLKSLPDTVRPSEVGNPWADLAGGGFFTDAAHQGHIHIGYGPRCTG